jgi:transcription termination/antitermination protein NusG
VISAAFVETESSAAPADAARGRMAARTPAWHVLWTRSNCEQLVCDQLTGKGFEVFLPTMEVWSRRGAVRRAGRSPLFPGYLFLHHALDKWADVEVRKARGLVAILGESWEQRSVVPPSEVEAIRTLMRSALPARLYPYMREGQRVRIARGPLTDVEGILLRTKPQKGLLVLSVELLRRSVAVEVDCTLAIPA